MNIRQHVLMIATGLLLATQTATAADQAPANYQVKFDTSAGEFLVDVKRELAPNGADRFHELVKNGFYNECRFFRVVPNFVVQFGINGDPEVQKKWRDARIADDKVLTTNARGTLTFATSGPNSRTSQLFINLKDNGRLDERGFSPFAKVIKGIEVVDKITAQYGERPDQGQIQARGNAYLKESFPRLDYIKSATIVKPE